jgi:hypothetical protein
MARTVSVTHKTRKQSAKGTARMIHSRATQDARTGTGRGSVHRRAVDAIDDSLETNKKRMTPETRRRLKLAKAEVRRLTGNDEPIHPRGGPSGRYLKKEKAKSRRNPTQPHDAPNKPRR